MSDDTATRPREEQDTTAQRSWLDAEVDGRHVRFWVGAGLLIALVVLSFGAWWTFGLDRGGKMAGGGMSPDAPRVPAVFGYYDGQPVAFIHPEASDPAIAQMLEQMMGSPVPVVASLADVPDSARGIVYVFANGEVPTNTPTGPLGFQPDVFDSVPGDPDYTPLREIVQVSWVDEGQAEVLTSAEQIRTAEAAGHLTLKRTGVVVNMPLLTWPGGQR